MFSQGAGCFFEIVPHALRGTRCVDDIPNALNPPQGKGRLCTVRQRRTCLFDGQLPRICFERVVVSWFLLRVVDELGKKTEIWTSSMRCGVRISNSTKMKRERERWEERKKKDQKGKMKICVRTCCF